MTAPEHDDPLHDAIALVESAFDANAEHARVILQNMNAGQVAAVLAKLVSELLADAERGVLPCRECFREWSLSAIRRLS